MHRVEAAKQVFAQRHHADKVIEDGAQLAFGACRIKALVIGFARWRGDIQRAAHHELRDVQLARAPIDFAAGDFCQVGHRRVSLKSRFLLSHGQHRTQVFVVGLKLLRGESGVNVVGPTLAIRNVGGQQLKQPRTRLFGRAAGQRLGALAAAPGDHNGQRKR